MRLKQTITLRASRGSVASGSLCRLGVRLQAHRWVASNLSLRPAQPTRQLSGSLPGPRQPPFGAGHEALSTGLWIPLAFRRVAFASWAFLFPLRAWAVLPKIVRLTGPGGQTATGLPRSAPAEARRGWVPPINGRDSPARRAPVKGRENGLRPAGPDAEVLGDEVAVDEGPRHPRTGTLHPAPALFQGRTPGEDGLQQGPVPGLQCGVARFPRIRSRADRASPR
jgi:hypothetical protein